MAQHIAKRDGRRDVDLGLLGGRHLSLGALAQVHRAEGQGQAPKATALQQLPYGGDDTCHEPVLFVVYSIGGTVPSSHPDKLSLRPRDRSLGVISLRYTECVCRVTGQGSPVSCSWLSLWYTRAASRELVCDSSPLCFPPI